MIGMQGTNPRRSARLAHIPEEITQDIEDGVRGEHRNAQREHAAQRLRMDMISVCMCDHDSSHIAEGESHRAQMPADVAQAESDIDQNGPLVVPEHGTVAGARTAENSHVHQRTPPGCIDLSANGRPGLTSPIPKRPL
jgi:hypothetical protein